jgi:hypothetical protein
MTSINPHSKAALLQKLRRLNYPKPGVLARFLLSAFPNPESANKIYASNLMDLGIIKPGTFKDMRKRLINDGFLFWVQYGTNDHKSTLFSPGPLLQKYLKPDDKISRRVDKVSDQVEQLLNQVRQHELEFKSLWEAIDSIQQNNPPVTKEKLQAHLKLVNTSWDD